VVILDVIMIGADSVGESRASDQLSHRQSRDSDSGRSRVPGARGDRSPS
jgi:hypothetical protein